MCENCKENEEVKDEVKAEEDGKMSYEQLEEHCSRLEHAYSLEKMFPSHETKYRNLRDRVQRMEIEHALAKRQPGNYEKLWLEVESLKKSKATDILLSFAIIGLQALLLWSELKNGK